MDGRLGSLRMNEYVSHFGYGCSGGARLYVMATVPHFIITSPTLVSLIYCTAWAASQETHSHRHAHFDFVQLVIYIAFVWLLGKRYVYIYIFF